MIGQHQHDEAEIEAGESGYDMGASTDIEPGESEYEMEENAEIKTGDPQKESTWFRMFFTPRVQAEAQAEDVENKEETSTERGSTETPQASNAALDSLLTDPEVKPSNEENGITSFDHNLLTQEEGTKVTKIEPESPSKRSLLDLDATKSESHSSDDETPKQGSKTESHPCADSKDAKLNDTEREPSEKMEEKARTPLP